MKENFNLSPNCNIDTSVPNKISIRLQPQVALFKTETKAVSYTHLTLPTTLQV